MMYEWKRCAIVGFYGLALGPNLMGSIRRVAIYHHVKCYHMWSIWSLKTGYRVGFKTAWGAASALLRTVGAL